VLSVLRVGSDALARDNWAMTSDSYRLSAGRHARPEQGRCAMEWVAHLAGETHSDRPECVSPVLGAFARSWNDALEDTTRQRLRPYLGRMIGTAGDGLDDARAWRCADWLARTGAPALLELSGLDGSALRRLRPIGDQFSARAAAEPVVAVAEAAAARRGEARAAAREETGEAGWGPALDGVRWATRLATRESGLDAARAALRAAERDHVRDGITGTAWGAAWNAAWAAAWGAIPGSPAARLAPTLAALQRSAFGLLDDLLPGETLELPRDQPAVEPRVVAGHWRLPA
jgi:hypothetical protein